MAAKKTTKKSAPKTKALPSIKIALIGGSGLYDLPGFDLIREVAVKTPFGAPSDKIKILSFQGIPVAFLPRHGAGHRILPGELNARANIYALKTLGVERLVSISAVGSLKEEIAPEDFVVPDQLIDRTRGRVSTFFGDGIVGHIPFAEPFCPELSNVVSSALKDTLSIRVHAKGTYLCMEGPAFSTKAESHLYRSWGCSVIGMTALPEAKLAREAGISYACIAMATDYDCWKEDAESVTIEQVLGHMKRNTENVKSALPVLLPRIAALGPSPWLDTPRFAVITAKDRIPAALRKKLAPLWGDRPL